MHNLHKEYVIGTIWAFGCERWQRRESPIWKYIGETNISSEWYPKIWIETSHEKDIYE